jgi:hypothetical protein
MGIATVAIVATTAHAQAPFADVPRDHWSYEAVNTLAQRGIVIGYPDGTFGGKRAMTRYEFATAIARMIPQFEQSIKDQIAAIPSSTSTPPDLSGYAKTSDLAAFVTKDDFDALKKLVDQFAPELQMLQVDVAGLRKDLASLTDRVTKIEKEIDRIKITGQADVIAKLSSTNRDTLKNPAVYAVNSSTNNFSGAPVDIDGRPLAPTTNLFEFAQIAYNTQLNIRARVSDTISAVTDVNIGNFAGAYAASPVWPNDPGFNRGGFPYGSTTKGSMNSEITPLKAYISAPLDLKLLGKVDFEAGKTGVQFTPYTLKLVDYDTYTNLPFTDNGEVIFTGAKGGFNIGGIAISAYAGTHGTSLMQGGPDVNGMFPNGAGYPVLFTGGVYSPNAPYAMTREGDAAILTMPEALFGARSNMSLRGLPFMFAPATQSAGIRAVLGTPLGGTLGLSYINAGINNTDLTPYTGVDALAGYKPMDVGRASVYGADLSLKLIRGIGVQAEYANSNMFERGKKFKLNTDNSVVDGKHEAIDAKLAFNIRTVALTAGYKKIDPLFGAPGSWGAIGGWKNPVNIKGYEGTVGVNLAKGLDFTGSAAQYRSIVAGVGSTDAAVMADDDNTRITHWTAGLKFNIGDYSKVDLGVENVRTKANPLINTTGATAEQTYYNLGYGAALSANSSFRLLYQIIDYRDKGAMLLNNGQDAKGSVAVGQFTVKF